MQIGEQIVQIVAGGDFFLIRSNLGNVYGVGAGMLAHNIFDNI